MGLYTDTRGRFRHARVPSSRRPDRCTSPRAARARGRLHPTCSATLPHLLHLLNMTVRNHKLLNAQKPLQDLAHSNLKGLHALALKEIMGEVEERLQRLQEVQQDLMQRAEDEDQDLTPEEADKEWQEVLEDDLQLDHEPLPREAVEEIEISAAVLMALDWLIQ